MAASAALRVPLARAFDTLHQRLGRPKIYVFPWQTPGGATYDEGLDTWVDGNGDIVTKTTSELSSYEVPALWGADVDEFALLLGGAAVSGDVTAIARAEYRSKFDNVLMVVTGDLVTGEKYTISDIENAPDGGAAIFVVVSLKRREN